MIQPPPDLLSTAPELVPGQRDWRHSLRLRPLDTSTPEGRAGERNRRIAWSIAISIVARGILIAVTFITIPLMVGYLGAERYGMWLTLSSLVAILGPLDLGVGNGLRQLVSEANGRDDIEMARRGISTAAVILSGIALVVLLVAPVLGIAVPWAAVYNVSTPLAVEEAAPTTVVLLALFAIGLPLSIVGVVQAARQSAYLTSAWSIVGGLGSIAMLLIVIASGGGLPVLVLAMTGSALVVAFINSGVYFGRQARSIAPRLRDYSPTTVRPLLTTGMLFLVLQVAGLIGYEIDNLVIAQVLGPEYVQQYAIPMKLFLLTPALLSPALMPLWPAYREAIGRKDSAWVRQTLRRSLRITFGVNVAAAALLVILGPMILEAWVGSAVSTTPALLVCMGLWAVAFSMSAALAMIINAANGIRVQAILAIMMASANAILSVLLVSMIGIVGAVIGSLIAQVVFILIPFTWYVPRLLKSVMGPTEPAPVA